MAQPEKLQLKPVDRSVDLAHLGEIADKLQAFMEELRHRMTAPHPRKDAPEFSASEVAALCGIDRARLHYLLSKEEEGLPQGTIRGGNRRRVFTLAEARAWVQLVAGLPARPAGERGRMLVCANFKGGSTKTTTSMCLAQALTLRGRRVLLVDVDPQASATELCGVYTDQDVDEEDTVMPFLYDPVNERLADRIRETYWDGLDIIAAHNALFAAEFQIPAELHSDPSRKFWGLLEKGLSPLTQDYDYIVIDSAPSLSYLSINALMAADAILMPLVPESIDFMSSAAFWGLFSDLARSFEERGVQKRYDFISVLLSKVEYGPTAASPVVREWAKRAYGDWLESMEVPASSAMSAGGLALSTAFDASKGDANSKTLARVKEPLEAYARQIDEYYIRRWLAAAESNGESAQ